MSAEQEHLYNKEEFARRIREDNEGIFSEKYFKSSGNVENEKRKLITGILNKSAKKGVFLEIGCHLGIYSLLNSKKDRMPIGLDYVFEGLQLGKKHSGSSKKNVHFVQADAVCLPFKEREVDVIFNIDFIEHIIHEKQSEVVREMARTLKRGGLVLTYTPNLTRLYMEYLINKAKYLFKGRHFGWQEDRPYDDRPDLKNHQDTKLHVGLLSLNQLKRLFLENRFKIKELYEIDYNIPFLMGFFKRFKIRAMPFYSLFCSNSMIMFEKI